MESLGFEAIEAGDGPSALRAFTRLKPDAILLDVSLPQVDGFSVCQALRGQAQGELLPIVMMAKAPQSEWITTAYEAGATDFVPKPINYKILGHRLRYLIRASHAMHRAQSNESRLANAHRIARLGDWEWTSDTGTYRLSKGVQRIFALPEHTFEATHDQLLDTVHPEDRAQVEQAFEDAFQNRSSVSIEHRIVLPSGQQRIVHQEAEVHVEEPEDIVHLIGTTQDITERKVAEEKIRNLAYFDTLTGLPNRALLQEHLGYVLQQAKRYNRLVAVLSVDLDLFKRINNTLGYRAGDALLQETSRRLMHCLRGDRVLGQTPGAELQMPNGMALSPNQVVRLGSDEFMVLLSEIRQPEDAAIVAERIMNALRVPYVLDGQEVVVTASIGIIIYPIDGEDVETLLMNADAALHHAKDAGRGIYQFYTQSMNARAIERLSLEGALRGAIERQELRLHYQPKIDLRTGLVSGMEALLRWEHPDLGMISPDRFIPVAEDTGQIVALGEWALREACTQNKRWQEAGLPAMRVAVNLSGRQFKEDDLLPMIWKTLEQTQLDPQYLEFEITERLLMEDTDRTCAFLHALRASGVHISIDDFGTGYSSLSYLNSFPIDALKIDQSFVTDVTSDAGSAAIVSAIIALSQKLSLEVVAEGVETEAQLDYLKNLDCDIIQGYFLSRPLRVDDFVTWMKDRDKMLERASLHAI